MLFSKYFLGTKDLSDDTVTLTYTVNISLIVLTLADKPQDDF